MLPFEPTNFHHVSSNQTPSTFMNLFPISHTINLSLSNPNRHPTFIPIIQLHHRIIIQQLHHLTLSLSNPNRHPTFIPINQLHHRIIIIQIQPVTHQLQVIIIHLQVQVIQISPHVEFSQDPITVPVVLLVTSTTILRAHLLLLTSRQTANPNATSPPSHPSHLYPPSIQSSIILQRYLMVLSTEGLTATQLP